MSQVTPISSVLQLATSAAVGRVSVQPGQRLTILPSVLTTIAFGNNSTTPTTTPQVMATGTLTSSGAFLDTETVTIDGVTYTFRTTLGVLANSVLIGANQTASHLNLQRAINKGAGGGSLYTLATVEHPTVWSSAVSGTTTVVLAKAAGANGNLIATTETLTNAAWGAAVLASGAGAYGQITLAAGQTFECIVPSRTSEDRINGVAVSSLSAISANGTLGIIVMG